jgi:2,4-didehydro-3-deoxy-L-rhamnonate hydrolase
MRIARYRDDETAGFGIVVDDAVRPVTGARTVVEAAAGAAADAVGEPIPLADLTLDCPVFPLVRNPFCVGWNYVDHFAEGAAARGPGGAQELPDRPTFFTKATTAIIGPFEAIAAHSAVTETLDWEVELAVVIGSGGSDIPEERAMDAVLGFAVANDVTARNVQRGHGGQWFRGKSLDATSPIGPWLVAPDELGEIGPQAITCRVNGETVQSATLADLHFGVPRIIAELSAGLTLLPGDVILTGTPSGVGFARTPPRYLVLGDVVESDIEGIGTLRNQVGR